MVDFDTFLDARRATLFPDTLPTLNLPTFTRVAAFLVM